MGCLYFFLVLDKKPPKGGGVRHPPTSPSPCIRSLIKVYHYEYVGGDQHRDEQEADLLYAEPRRSHHVHRQHQPHPNRQVKLPANIALTLWARFYNCGNALDLWKAYIKREIPSIPACLSSRIVEVNYTQCFWSRKIFLFYARLSGWFESKNYHIFDIGW